MSQKPSFKKILQVFREEEEIPDVIDDKTLLNIPLSEVDQNDLMSAFQFRISSALKEAGISLFGSFVINTEGGGTIRDLLKSIRNASMEK